jgi:hypothetical protein
MDAVRDAKTQKQYVAHSCSRSGKPALGRERPDGEAGPGDVSTHAFHGNKVLGGFLDSVAIRYPDLETVEEERVRAFGLEFAHLHHVRDVGA